MKPRLNGTVQFDLIDKRQLLKMNVIPLINKPNVNRVTLTRDIVQWLPLESLHKGNECLWPAIFGQSNPIYIRLIYHGV